MFGFLKKILGTQQSRLLKGYQKIVARVNEEEEKLASLTDQQLQDKTKEFKKRIQEGESLDSLLPEAYGVVKNSCRRLCGTEIHVSGYEQKWDMVPYDVQILGGIALHYGSIAEMQTGEGKTLTAVMPLYLNALTGNPVHLVTVNDYLVIRDCQWIGPVFQRLGMTVAPLTNQTPPFKRKEVYEADIVYGTASEFGFDYLRDNSMAQVAEEQSQRGHHFAIIDEVDSILIDEARTPLIISGPMSGNSRQMYDVLKEPVSQLIRMQRDFCNKLATEANKTLETLDQIAETPQKKLSKKQEAEKKEACHKLWLISKGVPNHKILKKIKENPDLRAEIDKWDVYYYTEGNKEEKSKTLSTLYTIIDERANEFELTDKGILLWSENGNSINDFTMLDLGFEYATIDQSPDLDESEKLKQKTTIREEDSLRKEKAHNLRQLLRAYLLMEKDVDYIVQENTIIIIDENTGRPQPGRRFADGLHQAIEAKEGVAIQKETQTYATITLQNYFRLYKKIGGMTGTAITEANEFKEIYKIDVLEIPTNKSCKRIDANDEIYMTEREKYNAILKEISEIHQMGRPILIGTESVDVSEKLSRVLTQNKLPHTVLNAKNHAKEAEIIAKAGHYKAITVATNMAGRGTDIKLQQGVATLGGLHVIGTTRSPSRRIDRQLRGRSARQGDPGSTKFYASFEDSLLRLFTSPRITNFLQRFRPKEGEATSAKILNRSIETAQKRVEQRNYQMRKHTLEYDDVINKHRSEIYTFRNEILHEKNPIKIAEDVLKSLCAQITEEFFTRRSEENKWDYEGLRTWLITHFPVTFEIEEFDSDYIQMAEVENRVTDKILLAFSKKIQSEKIAIQTMQNLTMDNPDLHEADTIIQAVVRNILIQNIDRLWQDHLLDIDNLKTEVHIRAVGQKDPLLEFKHEAFTAFTAFSKNLKIDIAHTLFKFTMIPPQAEKKGNKTIKAPLQTHHNFEEFKADLSLI